MMRMIRWLLRLLPADARDEYGEEILTVIRHQWRDVRQEGLAARTLFWLRQSAAVVGAAIRLRRDAEARDRARRPSGRAGFDGWSHDVRQAVRALVKRPGFTAVTVVTLGLGIGASTAIFSAVNAVLLRPLPYEEPDRVVVLFHEDAETGDRGSGFSAANVRDVRERSDLLEAAAVAEPWSVDLPAEGRVESLRAWAVSEGFFRALGADPVLGRSFTPDEYQPGADPVVLLGYQSWQNRFGGDPEVVGSTLHFQDLAVTVVGILGPEVKLPGPGEIWAPRAPQSYDHRQRTADYMFGVGRVRDDASVDQAQSELSRIARSLAEVYPETNASVSFRAVPLRTYLFGDVRTPLLVLLAAVGLVLLVACANVAGLMLSRGVRRQREYALRGALGASSGRLARQVTLESFALAAVGCLLGVGLTYVGVGIIGRLGPDHLPRIDGLGVDRAVLAFGIAVSGLSAFLSGIAPSLALSRPPLATVLSEGSRTSTAGRTSSRIRDRLVVAEIAAAVVLLAGAGLLSRSFTALLDEELGFEPNGRLAVQAFAYEGYDSAEERMAFVDEAVEGMEAIPGVERVALTSSVPAADEGALAGIEIDLAFTIEERPAPPVGQEPVASILQVTPGLFDVLEIPIVDGRAFTPSDRADAPDVVIVNERFARQHFGDRSPVGERIVIGFRPTSREIVGVVADVRPYGHESAPRPEVYFPMAQFPTSSLTFVLETRVPPGSVTEAAQEAIWEANPAQAIWGAATLDTLVSDWLKERTFNLLLMGSLAAIALALAGIGIYALISFSVEQRVAEMGIRRALGGGRSSILGLVVREGIRLAVAGLVLGLVAAVPLVYSVRTMLHGVEPTDPVLGGSLVVAILGLACLAAGIPAIRAMRIDPMVALRSD